MSPAGRGTHVFVLLSTRAPQVCTQCAHRQGSQPISLTRRAYSASPTASAVDVGIPTTPVQPSPATKPNVDKAEEGDFRLQAGIILSRPPLLTRQQTPFEQAFYLYQKRLNERLSTPFARQFFFEAKQPAATDFAVKLAERGKTMERGIGRMVRAGKSAWDDELLIGKGEAIADPDNLRETLYTDAESRVSEDGEALGFEDRVKIERPLSRITESDKTRDTRRLDRKLDRTLYLVVRKGDLWGFPKGSIRTEEDLYETAARALSGSAGVNMNTWIVGRAPIAYEYRKPVYKNGVSGEDREIKQHGAKIFYLKGRIMAGQVDLTENKGGIIDFQWLTKEELRRKIDQKTFACVSNSMPSR